MTTYIIRRLLIMPFILFGVTVLIFAMLTQLSPTQRASLYVRDVPKRQDQLEQLIEQYGLNDPIPQQYVRWIKSLAKGDLGFSKTGKEPVLQVILGRLPATAELALWAMIPIILVGIQLGIFAALHHNRLPDQLLRVFSIVGTSMPSFMAGLLLLMVFAAWLGWLPTGDRLQIPTGAETLRLKSYLIMCRNSRSDYAEFADLVDCMDTPTAAVVLAGIDRYYGSRESERQWVATQLVRRLADPRPTDVDDDGDRWTGPEAADEWERIRQRCLAVAVAILEEAR